MIGPEIIIDVLHLHDVEMILVLIKTLDKLLHVKLALLLLSHLFICDVRVGVTRLALLLLFLR